jgi:hypothetical protein
MSVIVSHRNRGLFNVYVSAAFLGSQSDLMSWSFRAECTCDPALVRIHGCRDSVLGNGYSECREVDLRVYRVRKLPVQHLVPLKVHYCHETQEAVAQGQILGFNRACVVRALNRQLWRQKRAYGIRRIFPTLVSTYVKRINTQLRKQRSHPASSDPNTPPCSTKPCTLGREVGTSTGYSTRGQ